MRPIVALLALIAGAAPAVAAPPAVPEELALWRGWVLHGFDHELCPIDAPGLPPPKRCVWPGVLKVRADANEARFSFELEAFAPVDVPLPGDDRLRPLDVTLNGRPVPALPADAIGRPGVQRVRVERGRHTIAGRFVYDARPDRLPIPPEVGLVELTLDGAAVASPRREEPGVLSLARPDARTAAEPAGGAPLDIHVQRLIVDTIPLVVETRILLRVSGAGREELTAPPLPAGFVAHDLISPLPARFEADGRLRIQVRPGEYDVRVRGRSKGPVASLTAPKHESGWAKEEVWAFDDQPELRIVQLTGAPPVDPSQTLLPPEWRGFPAYGIAPGTTVTLEERRRGDADPPPDSLTVNRRLTLDFDGGGFTADDTVSGEIRRGSRLEATPGFELSRVARGEGPDAPLELITRLGSGGRAGVELAEPAFHFSTVSRVPRGGWSIPSVGWAHDAKSMNAALELGPGWSLLSATGVDGVSGSWVQAWSLLDVFLVFVTVLALRRLFGNGVAAAALGALVLVWNESGAPADEWLVVAGAEALMRVVPAGAWGVWAQRARVAAWLWLAAAVLPFAVDQARFGLAPVAEDGRRGVVGASVYGWTRDTTTVQEQAAPAAAPAARDDEDKGGAMMEEGSGELNGMDNVMAPPDVGGRGRGPMMRKMMVTAPQMLGGSYDNATFDPNALVQTGVAKPEWAWRTVRLSWSGPVAADERLTLWLVPPWLNRLLAFVRAGAVLALAAFLVRSGLGGSAPVPAAGLPQAAAGTFAALLLLSAVPTPARADDVPPADVLNELRNRLLAPPPCAPDCVAVGRARITAEPRFVRVELDVEAGAAAAVALPGDAAEWPAQRVTLNGKPTAAVARNGDRLHVLVPAGTHRVVAEGPAPDREGFRLLLLPRPRNTVVRAVGWSVEGVRENGTADDALVFTRGGSAGDVPGGSGDVQSVAPFFEVTRTLRMGLTWNVETQVTRIAGAAAPATVAVALLPGESVTTDGVRTGDGKALVPVPAGGGFAAFSSSLATAPKLVLAGSNDGAYAVVWRIEAGTIWHVEPSGIPPVGGSGGPSRTWRPWPGESVSLDIKRPEAVPGPSLTVMSATLATTPGIRATEHSLEVLIVAGRGVDHPLSIGAGAVLQSVSNNGEVLPLRADDGRLTLPVRPGTPNRFVISWREPTGAAFVQRTPAVDLGAPGANVAIHVNLPPERWLLASFGFPVGPVVLFWAWFAVVAAAAIGLGRFAPEALGTREWLLLGAGLAPIGTWATIAVALFFWLLARRERYLRPRTGAAAALDAVFGAYAVCTALGLIAAVSWGLLGTPDMRVTGNASGPWSLRFFADRTEAAIPRATVVSGSIWLYRALMLAWALWLASSVLGWGRRVVVALRGVQAPPTLPAVPPPPAVPDGEGPLAAPPVL